MPFSALRTQRRRPKGNPAAAKGATPQSGTGDDPSQGASQQMPAPEEIRLHHESNSTGEPKTPSPSQHHESPLNKASTNEPLRSPLSEHNLLPHYFAMHDDSHTNSDTEHDDEDNLHEQQQQQGDAHINAAALSHQHSQSHGATISHHSSPQHSQMLHSHSNSTTTPLPNRIKSPAPSDTTLSSPSSLSSSPFVSDTSRIIAEENHNSRKKKYRRRRNISSPNTSSPSSSTASPSADSHHHQQHTRRRIPQLKSPPSRFTHHKNSLFQPLRKNLSAEPQKRSTLSALLSRDSTSTSSTAQHGDEASRATSPPTNEPPAPHTAQLHRSALSASLQSESDAKSKATPHASLLSSHLSNSSSHSNQSHPAATHSESSSSSSAPRAIPTSLPGTATSSYKSPNALTSSLLTSSLSKSATSTHSSHSLGSASYTHNQSRSFHNRVAQHDSAYYVKRNPTYNEGITAPDHQLGFIAPPERKMPVRNFCRRLVLVFMRIDEAYQLWYLDHKYKKKRKCFTSPSEIDVASTNRADNKNGDLVIHAGDVIYGRFFAIDLLGTGTFGIVVKCEDLHTGDVYALKVIKNRDAYNRQAIVEIRILQKLKRICDVHKKHIIKMECTFTYKDHLCIVSELLSINLYELLVQNQYQGLKWVTVRTIMKQMLEAMIVLQGSHIVHADLKPENILLCRQDSSTDTGENTMSQTALGKANEQSPSQQQVAAKKDASSSPRTSPETPQTNQQAPSAAGLIKLIDFGSACYEGHTMYSYIQSRFYRSPEVLLGLPYNGSIDVWSLGCIAAELFLGLPLFPGHSQHNQVCRIMEVLGPPPKFMIEQGKFGLKHFKKDPESGEYVLKTEEEYCQEYGGTPQKTKRYFKYIKLERLVMNYNRDDDKSTTDAQRHALIHLIRGCLNWNPYRRWTVDQVMEHPMIRGDVTSHFSRDWKPPRSRKQVFAPPYSSHRQQQYGGYPNSYGSNGGNGSWMPNYSPYTNHGHVQSSYSPNGGNSAGMRGSMFSTSSSYGSPSSGPVHYYPPPPSNGSYTQSGFVHPMAASPQVRPGCLPTTTASYTSFQRQFSHYPPMGSGSYGTNNGSYVHGSPLENAHAYPSPQHFSSQHYFSSSYNQSKHHGSFHNTPHSFHAGGVHYPNSGSYSNAPASNMTMGSMMPSGTLSANPSIYPPSDAGSSAATGQQRRKTRPRSHTWAGQRQSKNAMQRGGDYQESVPRGAQGQGTSPGVSTSQKFNEGSSDWDDSAIFEIEEE